jgi:aspartate carbamoyltransferase catalytic subunit
VNSLEAFAVPEHGRHVIDARQFQREWIEKSLFPLARTYQLMPASELPQVLAGKRLFFLFHQESTRTRISFESAVTLLGGSVAGLDSQRSGRSRSDSRTG